MFRVSLGNEKKIDGLVENDAVQALLALFNLRLH